MDCKPAVCMANNGNYTYYKRHIARRVKFLCKGKKWKIQKIDWFEGGLQLADIANKNVGENDLNPIMKYIMVRIENWYIKLVQERWQDIGYSVGTRVVYD